MKTPSDSFENYLQQLDLREIPAHWKDEILAKARSAPRRRFAPPRPLAIALAAAWAVILTLALLTPSPRDAAVSQKPPVFAPDSLFALNQQLTRSLP
jgi:hypothetical protein